jgi:uncharacterized protein (DUF952 family)
MIYHVITQQAYDVAMQKGFYEAESLAIEGFIHYSQAHQIQGVLDRYYQNVPQLLLMHCALDTHEKLVWETAPSIGEKFPHLYAAMPTSFIEKVVPIDATNVWKQDIFMISAAIQIVPLQTTTVAYPLIDEVIAIIKKTFQLQRLLHFKLLVLAPMQC